MAVEVIGLVEKGGREEGREKGPIPRTSAVEAVGVFNDGHHVLFDALGTHILVAGIADDLLAQDGRIVFDADRAGGGGNNFIHSVWWIVDKLVGLFMLGQLTLSAFIGLQFFVVVETPVNYILNGREMVRWDVLGYGTLLALVDVVMMPIAKGVAKKALPLWMMVIPTLIYAADPWIFLQSLKCESMVVMNLVWDLVSDILVTFTGLVLLGEKISTMKSIGVGLSFVSLYFLSHESV